MHSILYTIGVIAGHNLILTYASFYLAIIFLGNIGIFAGLLVVTEGRLGPWGILFFLVTVFAAEISGDLAWYSLGRMLRGTRAGEFLKNHIPHHTKIENHLQKNCRRWIFLSKFLYGTTFPITFMVGWSKVNFKKFFEVSVLAIFIAVPPILLIALALIQSVSYLKAVTSLHRFEWLFAVAFVIFIACDIAFAKTVKKFFGKNGDNTPSVPPRA